jgi:isopropylmalate/homocitrate/citramalate synthase
LERIASLGLKTKILTHVRCHMDDAKLAIDTGADGIDVVFGTSSLLREFSHGKDIPYIIDSAREVIEFIKSQGLEVRFSSEDSFRSDLVDLLSIYRAVDKIGVNRVGIADTVGVANPRQVYDLVKTLRSVVSLRHRVSRPQRHRLRRRQRLLRAGSGRDARGHLRAGHRRTQRHHLAGRAGGAHVRL